MWRNKLVACVQALETEADALAASRFTVGHLAIGVALGYLDFRFGSLGWREKYPDTSVWFDRFAKRDSMMSTRPPAG